MIEQVATVLPRQKAPAQCRVQLDPGIIQRSSPLPLYFQLAAYMEEKIRSRAWVAGQVLPSEEEFCVKLGISRTVVRQAVAGLEAKSLVVKQSGKRSCVAFPKYEGGLMQSLRGFHEDTMASGQKPAVKVLDLKVIGATAEVAASLGLQEGDPVIMLNRLRYLDDEPEAVEVTYLPERLCPGLAQEDFSNHSLYELLEHKYGLEMDSGRRTIEAVAADRTDARLLGVRTGSPLLVLKGIGILANGRQFEFFIARHRGDRSRFRVQVMREPAAR